MKVVKERNLLIKFINGIFRISAGFERLIFFVIVLVVLSHIASCFWYFKIPILLFRVLIAKLDEFNQNTWVTKNNYQDSSNAAIYVAAVYFVLTTVTTVGFGDISGNNSKERVMCIVLMCIGVFAFSFSIGSLSSVLSTLDSRKADLKEKMSSLNKIKRQYKISQDLFRKLKMSIKYQHQRSAAKQFAFLNDLP